MLILTTLLQAILFVWFQSVTLGGEFKKDNIKRAEDMLENFAYILVVRFIGIKSKYYNNFISFSKCREIRGGHYDNGRVVSADSLEITLTDVDFKFLLKAYKGNYKILESYSTYYRYLPKQYINFILDKYEDKTKLKNVEGREIEYALAKNSFNSLYRHDGNCDNKRLCNI